MPLISSAALLLDEIARSGSIRSAAERLNASASAVNRQLLNLEAEVGVPLFERLPRGVRLTAAGEVLVGEVRRWRRDHERAEARIRELKGLQRGQVTIGAMECFTRSLLPRAVAALQGRHPRVVVDLIIGGTEKIVERLVNRTLDIALCFNPSGRQHLTTLARASAPSGLVLSPDHPLAGHGSITLADCAPYTFVVPDRSLGLRALFDEAMRRAGQEPLAPISTNSTALMKALVEGGSAVTLMNRFDVIAEVAARTLCFVPITGLRLPPEELSLCIARDRPLSPQASALTEILREEIAHLTSSLDGAEA